MIDAELETHRVSRDSDYDDGVYVGPRDEQQPISISEMVAHIASEKELRRPIYSMTPDYAERMIQLEAEVHVLKQKVANLCDTIAALIDVIDQRSETPR
jgi:hypothetical protein